MLTQFSVESVTSRLVSDAGTSKLQTWEHWPGQWHTAEHVGNEIGHCVVCSSDVSDTVDSGTVDSGTVDSGTVKNKAGSYGVPPVSVWYSDRNARMKESRLRPMRRADSVFKSSSSFKSFSSKCFRPLGSLGCN